MIAQTPSALETSAPDQREIEGWAVIAVILKTESRPRITVNPPRPLTHHIVNAFDHVGLQTQEGGLS
jgi:hypothetical protein